MELTQKQFYNEMFDTKVVIIFCEYCLIYYKILEKIINAFVFVLSILCLSNIWLQIFDGKYTTIALILQIVALALSYIFPTRDTIISLESSLKDLASIYDSMIVDWGTIADGKLTNKEVSDYWEKYRKQKQFLSIDYFFALKYLFLNKSAKETDEIFIKYFCVTEQNNDITN